MHRKLQKIGNSRGVVLDRTMREHIGVEEAGEIEITLIKNAIEIRAIRPKQPFEEAMNATFEQYGDALKRLAE